MQLASTILIAALLATSGCARVATGSAVAENTGRRPVRVAYLGNAGWQIEADHTVILVDPNLSQFRDRKGDTEQLTGDDPTATADVDAIDAHVQRADYILITHGHDDHMLDAPYIAKRTGAVIICHESAANIARAHGIGDEFRPDHVDLHRIHAQPLVIVRGGEDFQFATFSLAVIPSLHTALFDKRYNDGFWAGSTPAGLQAPLRESDYKEGGTLIYLLRIAGHQIFIMGSMNYIEREITGMRPDIAIVGAGASRTQLYRYTGRLMTALGQPPVVLPTHWDDFATKARAEALEEVAAFASEVHASSPRSRVIVPEYFVPIELR